MINYISKRIMLAAVTIFFVSFLSYVIIDLPPGDYVDKLIEIQVAIGQMEIPTAEEEYALRERYDLNKPMLVRYVDWIWKILSDGNFGPSYGSGSGYTASGFGTPVSELFGERIILTIALAAFTMIITWLFSIPVGIYTAVRQHSVGDYTFTFIDSYGDGLLASQNAGVQVYEGCGDLSCSEAHWESPEDAVLHESPEEVLGL